ncbi:N-acetylmannosamine kinase [Vibrio sp. CB1-14]|uniref:N-acetylmannosamine kinase n=1 Tax=Vibrio chaetopteri TaxID=3016528 RepID=A0AAU8BTW4_9VIBR
MSTLAIDIGGTKVALGMVENGKLIERTQIATPSTIDVREFANHILSPCSEWLEKAQNIGISTTGWVKPEGITSINPDTLPFPQPFALHREVERTSDRPVAMLNDAQAAACFEFKSHANLVKNMAYVTVSTGVGGGIIIDGKLHKGSNWLAGHIGHTVIDINGPDCGCGQNGCVEAIASGTAINKVAQATINPTISNIELFELARNDASAMAIIKRSAQAIAVLCTNLKATYDLDLVVLGGGVGLASHYMELVDEYIQQKPAAFRVPITKASGDYDACLLGAAEQFSLSLDNSNAQH